MTTTCSRMAVIQGFLSLIIGETSSKNGVNPTTIKSVAEDNILTGLVTYATMVISKQSGLKILILEINNDISIPKVNKADQKEGFVR
jgi:hypothetical protein